MTTSSSRVTVTAYADAGGAPLAGLTPTWHYFKNLADGSARTPQPTIRDDGLGAYSFPHGLSEGEAFQGLIDFGATANPRYREISLRYEDTLDRTLSVTGTGGTWTYSNDPANVPRDAVRSLLGDTDSADPQPLTDAEVAWLLTESGDSTYRAAAAGARKLAGYYSRQADIRNGALSVSSSQRAKAFRTLALELDAQAFSAGAASVFVGGISISANEALDEDSDAVQPAFRIGQDDYIGHGSYEREES